MQTLEEAARNAIECRNKLKQAELALFSANKSELYSKLREIAFILIRGTQEPKTCGESNSILFAIKDFTDEEFDKLKYPASCIDWDIYYLNNILQIEARVEAYFSGEQDAAMYIVFPVNDAEYNVFITGLNKKAREREDALEAKEAKEKALEGMMAVVGLRDVHYSKFTINDNCSK